MSFEDLVGAIRAADGEDPELAAVTQRRVRRSLESRAHSRHQLAGFFTAAAILLGGTVSWALATGEISTLWAPAPQARQAPQVPVEVAPPPPPVRPHRQAMAIVPSPEIPPPEVPETSVVPVTPVVPAPVTPVTAPRPRPRAPVAPPVEGLYRRAHELHFHGGDPVVTLAAWDAYLTAEPTGRFSVEARYNRALLLVRLGRYTDARAALAPFARGEVAPAGYRQTEAEQLIERLARYE